MGPDPRTLDPVEKALGVETILKYENKLMVTVTHLFGGWYWMPAVAGWNHHTPSSIVTFVGVSEYGGEVLYSMEYKVKTRWGAIMKEIGRLDLPLDNWETL